MHSQANYSNTPARSAPRNASYDFVARTVSMTSSEISDLTGKQHAHVIRDIRTMIGALQGDPVLDHVREDKDGRDYTENFHLNRDLTETLITGYSIPLRLKVIRRLHELEQASADSTPSLDTDESKLLLIQQLATKQLALITENKQITFERDRAVATKAEIGNRREATAMATASAAVRETNRLKAELGRNAQAATIIAVEKACDLKLGKQAFRPLQKWCKSKGITSIKVPCPRYGEAAAWPAQAWLDCYTIDLTEVFGAS